MTSIEINYGAVPLQISMEWGVSLGRIDIADVPSVSNRVESLRRALEKPIGLPGPLLEHFRAGDAVTIVVSDAYRNTAVDQILPAILDALADRGIRNEAIQFLFATGIHKAPDVDQQRAILGDEVYARFRQRAHVHDPYAEDHAQLGTTARGTPVEINRRAIECDHVIVTGAVVMHYFGGFGGGRKALVPGISSARTIARNHAMNLHPTENRLNPAVCIGVMDGNPVAEDMLEAALRVPNCNLINTVLNRRGEIAGLFAGALEAAHVDACAFARSLYAVPIADAADIVIASAGTARNYVQAHKALYNAYQAMKPGGCIILLAPSLEGLGGEPIEKWLRLGSVDAIIAALRASSEIYGQTALSTLEKAAQAIMVTNLPSASVGILGARKAVSLDDALRIARREYGDHATYYVMPSASHTVPILYGLR
ncbi:MAG: nickel-dependent lactate racemase [Candidatus Hydrogenedentes bacterium]|nr:nickel-dependent lactate racemase [Candidatus Hydrogenedentota bacterium]